MYKKPNSSRLAILPCMQNDFLEDFAKKLATKIQMIGSMSPVLGILNENDIYEVTPYEKRVFSWNTIDYIHGKYIELFTNENLNIRTSQLHLYPSDQGYDFLDCDYWLILQGYNKFSNVVTPRKSFMFPIDSLLKCNNCNHEQTELVFKNLISDLNLVNNIRYL